MKRQVRINREKRISDGKGYNDKLESVRLFGYLVKNMLEGVLILKLDSTILFANEQAAKLLGLQSAHELLGKKSLSFVHPDSKDLVRKNLERIIRRGEDRLRNLYRLKDIAGEERWVETCGTRIDFKEQFADLVTFRDVTDRKKAEEALRDSEYRYRSLFENMLDGFAYCKMVLDDNDHPIDFVYLEINDALERLTGLKKENVVGKKVTEVIPGIKDAHPELFDIYGKVALTGKEAEFDIYFKPLEIWLSISVYSPRKGYFVAVFENITERKKAEEKLQEYSEKLEEMVEERTKDLRVAQEELVRSGRLATLGQLSGSISHELRNPLGVIGSSAYYLKTRLKDADEKVKDHLGRIKSGVDRATGIIESLLSLTRMEEPRLETLNLITIVSEAVATSKVPTTVKVVKNFPDEDVLVRADREQFHMVFQNIIKNALEAMDRKGTLTVGVRKTTHDRAEVSFADTGPGIAPENLDRIFQPLFSTKARGIGLGLSIAKMIIDKHGGKIEAKSELGKGAILIIQLPLYIDKGKEA